MENVIENKKRGNKQGRDGQGGTLPPRNSREIFGGGRIYKPINLRADGSEGERENLLERKKADAGSVARIYGGLRKKQKQNAVEFLFPAVAKAFQETVRLAISSADLQFGK